MKIINALLLISFLPLLITARLTSSDVSATELEQKLHKRGIKPTRQGTRRVKSKGSKGDKSSKGGKSEKSQKSNKSENNDPVQPPKPTVPKNWQEKCPEIKEANTSVHSVSLSDDGNTMAIGYFGFAKVYQFDSELDTCTEMKSFYGGTNLSESSVSLSADGLTLAVALPEVHVYRFNGIDWDEFTPDVKPEGTNVIVSRNGSRVAIANFEVEDSKGKVSVYRVNDWVKLGDDFVGDNQKDQFGVSISFGKNGKRIAIGTLVENAESYVRIYDWKEGAWEILSPNVGEEDSTREEGSQLAVSLSENGKTLAIGTSKDGAGAVVNVYKYRKLNGIKIWKPIGQQIQSTYDELFGQGIALSNNGKKLAVAGEGFAQIFQFKKKFNRWNGVSGIIEGAEDLINYSDVIAISGDGKTVAYGGVSTKVLKYE